ncbi:MULTISPECIES: hypothetical protein [unclassified Streptomyces]|uniref:hypothetical protein n=1 Tax=unclassified Streptomyces TaxID=2593676 RepID=UPI002472FB91|nr:MULTISPECIES: hypothetical protein [unclassified Streptomyces]MDH6454605.1 hypothetical protein [Streptomyces sp. SAI-119]MDH6494837.1 hypothetical protein [Streptomyces sp. SAI-149]
MPIERVVAFRFHRDPLISRARVGLLRRLNPGVPVHGIFGGANSARGTAFQLAGRRLLGLDSLYSSPRDGHWNWKNGDLVLLDWYRERGHRLTFDVLHLVEWDLLLTEPLDRLYGAVPPEAVGLTALAPLSVIGDEWRWLAGRDEAREWRELLSCARTGFGYDGTPYGCLGVGPCFPRAFLRDYAAADPPDLGNDELRYPLFAQLLGHPMADTGFRRAWHSPDDDRYFNAVGAGIDPHTVTAELETPGGRRAFHPVRAPLRGLRLPAPGPSGLAHGPGKG